MLGQSNETLRTHSHITIMKNCDTRSCSTYIKARFHPRDENSWEEKVLEEVPNNETVSRPFHYYNGENVNFTTHSWLFFPCKLIVIISFFFLSSLSIFNFCLSQAFREKFSAKKKSMKQKSWKSLKQSFDWMKFCGKFVDKYLTRNSLIMKLIKHHHPARVVG